jgi:hypothetical protein
MTYITGTMTYITGTMTCITGTMAYITGTMARAAFPLWFLILEGRLTANEPAVRRRTKGREEGKRAAVGGLRAVF